MTYYSDRVARQTSAIRDAARTHRGESPVQFHLRAWADELNLDESTDFHHEDDSFNVAVLANLLDEGGIGPVYYTLLPLLEHLTDMLRDDNEDDLDASELAGALGALAHFLNSRDTTVRETY
jgi:hypothetical protein